MLQTHKVPEIILAFFFLTILFSNALGTALGDFFADDSGLGYEGAALVFAGLLALLILGSEDEDSRSP